ncbi:hypothetical protein R1flu_012749 [Riccia fluitans]|uniref:Uncharacterized protein n=1 Tax=Riccia fluitans TaxID=41844 RepID=A0ABD1ZBH2_9MARC
MYCVKKLVHSLSEDKLCTNPSLDPPSGGKNFGEGFKQSSRRVPDGGAGSCRFRRLTTTETLQRTTNLMVRSWAV